MGDVTGTAETFPVGCCVYVEGLVSSQELNGRVAVVVKHVAVPGPSTITTAPIDANQTTPPPQTRILVSFTHCGTRRALLPARLERISPSLARRLSRSVCFAANVSRLLAEERILKDAHAFFVLWRRRACLAFIRITPVGLKAHGRWKVANVVGEVEGVTVSCNFARAGCLVDGGDDTAWVAVSEAGASWIRVKVASASRVPLRIAVSHYTEPCGGGVVRAERYVAEAPPQRLAVECSHDGRCYRPWGSVEVTVLNAHCVQLSQCE